MRERSHEGRTHNPTQIIGFQSICLYDYNNSKTEHNVTAAFMGSLQVTVQFEKRDVSLSVGQHWTNNVSKCLMALSKRPTAVTAEIIHVNYIDIL